MITDKYTITIINSRLKRNIKILQNFFLLLSLLLLFVFLIIGFITGGEESYILAYSITCSIIFFGFSLLLGLFFYFIKQEQLGIIYLDFVKNEIELSFKNELEIKTLNDVSFVLNDYKREQDRLKKMTRLPPYGNYIILAKSKKYEIYPDKDFIERTKHLNVSYERRNFLESRTLLLFKEGVVFLANIFHN